MLKEKRQKKIRSLIRAKNITTQDELTKLLLNANFPVTQSSVSRDLEKMGVIKINGFYALPKNSKKTSRFGLLSLETAGAHLVVAKCEAGLASAVAVRIDDAKFIEIIGTVAGDDTIFIAVKDAKAQKIVMKKIWETFEE